MSKPAKYTALLMILSIAFVFGMGIGSDMTAKANEERVLEITDSIRDDYYTYQDMYDKEIKNPMTYIQLFENRYKGEN